jgi:hypothetical protein
MTKSNGLKGTKELMAALGRMPPKPHEEMKIGKPRATRPANTKRKRSLKKKV